MNAKIRKGINLLFMCGESNIFNNIKDCIVINLNDRYTYQSFKQKGRHLLIYTEKGLIDIVFTGQVPNLEFDVFCKDQLIFNIK